VHDTDALDVIVTRDKSEGERLRFFVLLFFLEKVDELDLARLRLPQEFGRVAAESFQIRQVDPDARSAGLRGPTRPSILSYDDHRLRFPARQAL
jgi:hypothetical protein